MGRLWKCLSCFFFDPSSYIVQNFTAVGHSLIVPTLLLTGSCCSHYPGILNRSLWAMPRSLVPIGEGWSCLLLSRTEIVSSKISPACDVTDLKPRRRSGTTMDLTDFLGLACSFLREIDLTMGDSTAGCNVKLVLLGDSGVGKTSLVLRFVHNEFHPFQESTIGAAFFSKAVKTTDSSDRWVQFKIWDTAGQERYQSLTPLYFRGADVAVLVYDITRIHSFQTLQRWVRELRAHGPPSIIMAVVGNKVDLADHRSVQEDDARHYAESIDALYMETSCRDNNNVTELFQELATRAAAKAPTVNQGAEQGLDLGSSNPRRDNCCWS